MCSLSRFRNLLRPHSNQENSDSTTAQSIVIHDFPINHSSPMITSRLVLVLQLFLFLLVIFAIVYFHAQAQQTKLMFKQCANINSGVVRKKRSKPEQKSASIQDLSLLPSFRSDSFKRRVVTVFLMAHNPPVDIYKAKLKLTQATQSVAQPTVKIEHTCKCQVTIPDKTKTERPYSAKDYIELCSQMNRLPSNVSAKYTAALSYMRKHRTRHRKNKHKHELKSTTTTLPTTSSPRDSCKLEIVGKGVFMGEAPIGVINWLILHSSQWIMQRHSPSTILIYPKIDDMENIKPTIYHLPFATIGPILNENGRLIYVKRNPTAVVIHTPIVNETEVLHLGLIPEELPILYNNSAEYLVDIAVDKHGLWIIHRDPRNYSLWHVHLLNLGGTVVYKTQLHVEINVAETLLVCGILYVIDSSTDKFSHISHAYELWSGASYALHIPWMNSRLSLVRAFYDYTQNNIKIIDGRGLMSAPVRIK